MLKIKKQTAVKNSQGQRFEYAEGVAFWVRPLTATVLRDLRKQCIKTKLEFDPKSRKMESIEEIDGEKFDTLLTDHILDLWEGVGGEDGQPLPVTLESKKMILDQLPLRDFIWAMAQSLDTSEAEAKNS